MFGGHGIYLGDVMFALVAGDALYLKIDAITRRQFEGLNLRAFSYMRGDKSISMSYFEAPCEMFEDPELAVQWAHAAYDAALRERTRIPG